MLGRIFESHDPPRKNSIIISIEVYPGARVNSPPGPAAITPRPIAVHNTVLSSDSWVCGHRKAGLDVISGSSLSEAFARGCQFAACSLSVIKAFCAWELAVAAFYAGKFLPSSRARRCRGPFKTCLFSSFSFLLSSCFFLLSSVFCLLSSVFCLLSSVFCLLSSVFCLLQKISEVWPRQKEWQYLLLIIRGVGQPRERLMGKYQCIFDYIGFWGVWKNEIQLIFWR